MKKILIVSLLSLAGIAHAITDDCSIVESSIRTSMSTKMKDPDSVQFRNIKFYRYDNNGKDSYVATGEVNGKNSYGGYVGFAPFGINILDTPKGPFAFLDIIVNSRMNANIYDKSFGWINPITATLICSK